RRRTPEPADGRATRRAACRARRSSRTRGPGKRFQLRTATATARLAGNASRTGTGIDASGGGGTTVGGNAVGVAGGADVGDAECDRGFEWGRGGQLRIRIRDLGLL